jgi:hypothetical protein
MTVAAKEIGAMLVGDEKQEVRFASHATFTMVGRLRRV